MKIRLTLLAVLLLAPAPAFAHPGHDQHMTMTTVGLWAALAFVNLVLVGAGFALSRIPGRRLEHPPHRHPGESRDPYPPLIRKGQCIWVPAFAGMTAGGTPDLSARIT